MLNANRPQRITQALRAARVLLPLAAAGCGAGAGVERAERLERLDGAWTVAFRLEHPATLSRDAAGVPPVRGTVVLLENERPRAIDGLSGVPTHYGVYAADLRPLDGPGPDHVPTLVVRLARGDSVQIAFDPEQGHSLAGRGVLAGDSVSGRWWSGGTRTAPRSSGRFTMRRP